MTEMMWLAGALATVAGAPLMYRRMRQRQIRRALALDPTTAIAESAFVRIGGVEQWISIRGEDRANPVVLMQYGGEGGIRAES